MLCAGEEKRRRISFVTDIVESADQDVLNDSSELLKVKVYLIILNSG